jgi:translation initiation factor eIF-2B subunit epsilon
MGYRSTVKDDLNVKTSVVGNKCKIKGNIKGCIVWDDVCVCTDLLDCVVFSSDDNGVAEINVVEKSEESGNEEEVAKDVTFFKDILDYLNSIVKSTEKTRVNMEEISRQVSLLRIVWNASDLDLVEAFSIFLVNMINPDDVDGSTIGVSVYFSLCCVGTRMTWRFRWFC